MDFKILKEGIRDGLPIGLGYFAVAFSLGVTARHAGLTQLQGFISGILNHASAGEYALYNSIMEGVTYAEVAIITLVVNARYLLMSFSLSQYFDPASRYIQRWMVGFGITDEIYGITISRSAPLQPYYCYGAMLISLPLWGLGIALGITAGTIFPQIAVSALSVALYGMFIAIIIPASKKHRAVAYTVVVSFACSYLFGILPFSQELSEGTRTIILTILISVAAAIVAPIPANKNFK